MIMKKIWLIFKNGQIIHTTGEEVVYYDSCGSLFIDGEQTVIYNEEVADDWDIIDYDIIDYDTVDCIVVKEE